MRLSVIYALPQKYATSIRLKNLVSNLKNIEIKEIKQKYWPNNLFIKIILTLKQRIKSLIYIKKEDIVYASAPLVASSIPALVLKSLKKNKLIIDWDDGFYDFSKFKPKPWDISYWEYLAIKKSDKVVVVSKKLKNLAIKLGKKQRDVVYIPNGVNTDLFDPTKYSKYREKIRKKYKINNKKVIGFVGSIPRIKNSFVGKEIVDTAIKINDKNIFFMIVGFGEGLEYFKKYVELKNLKKQFIFIDYVDHKDVPKYISAFDICLVPFEKRAFTSLTRSSCKLKEFMSMDKPIVTVSVGENKTDLLNGKYGILVKNKKFLYLGLKKFLNNHLSMKPRVRAKEYDFKILSKRLMEII